MNISQLGNWEGGYLIFLKHTLRAYAIFYTTPWEHIDCFKIKKPGSLWEFEGKLMSSLNSGVTKEVQLKEIISGKYVSLISVVFVYMSSEKLHFFCPKERGREKQGHHEI